MNYLIENGRERVRTEAEVHKTAGSGFEHRSPKGCDGPAGASHRDVASKSSRPDHRVNKS